MVKKKDSFLNNQSLMLKMMMACETLVIVCTALFITWTIYEYVN
jgi:hypothetical protein